MITGMEIDEIVKGLKHMLLFELESRHMEGQLTANLLLTCAPSDMTDFSERDLGLTFSLFHRFPKMWLFQQFTAHTSEL